MGWLFMILKVEECKGSWGISDVEEGGEAIVELSTSYGTPKKDTDWLSIEIDTRSNTLGKGSVTSDSVIWHMTEGTTNVDNHKEIS